MAIGEPQFRNLKEAIISANLQTGATLIDEWVYKDEGDLEVFRVLVYESEDDGRRQIRTVWPVWPGTEEGWRMGEPPAPLPLYRLPEIEPFQRVYVCQSEKAAEAARSAGLVATAPAFGCYAVDKTDWTPLAGRDVVILPENNEAGCVFVRKVTGRLARQLPPAEVRVVEFPGVGDHGDICQYLLNRHPRKLELIGADIDQLADDLPEYWTRRRALPAATTRLLDVAPAAVQWLWPGRIALGKLNLLYGHCAWGRSPLGLDLAARVSRGSPWPDGSGTAPRGAVILLNYQDSLADTILPQLKQAGADLTRIFALGAGARTPAGRPQLTSIAALHRAIDEAILQNSGGAKLVLIDPMNWYLSGNANAALGALAALAAERRVAVVMFLPLVPPTTVKALDGPALTAARSAWLAAPDAGDAGAAGDTGRRLMLPLKTEAGAESTGLAFRIVGGRIEWETEPVHLTAQDVLRARPGRRKPGPPPVKLAAVADWLRQRLARRPAYVGNAHADEPGTLRREAKDAGLSWATVRRAFKVIHAVSVRCPPDRQTPVVDGGMRE